MSFAFRKKQEAQTVSTAAPEVPESFGLFDKIAQYEYIENLLEETITEQETLSRQFYAKQVEQAKELVAAQSGEMVAREDLSITDIAFHDFQRLRDLAQKVVPNGLPNAHRRFVLKACSPEMVAIEDLEETIKLYRYRLGIIEQEILDHKPLTTLQSAAKLKFMSSLMLDGVDIEHDYFFYLVEECALVIEKAETRRAM